FGEAHDWASPGFSVTVQNPVRLEMTPDYGTRTFSPNADGQEDDVTAGYCLSRNATIDIVVKNASNTVVRHLESDASVSGTYFSAGYCRSWFAAPVTWDGKNDANAVVPNGNYSIVIEATDS